MSARTRPLSRVSDRYRDFGTDWGRCRLCRDAVGGLRMIGISRGAGRDYLAGLFRSRHRSQKQLGALREDGLVEIER